MPNESFPTPVVGRQLLHCYRCHRSNEVTHADLMQYMKKAWPKCCGEVMSYFTEAKHPSPTADTDERPALS